MKEVSETGAGRAAAGEAGRMSDGGAPHADNASARSWMLTWALVQGAALWGLHGQIHAWGPDVLWPLYAVVLAVPLTLQMLANQRARRSLWAMAALLGLVFAVSAAYVGNVSMAENRGQGARLLVLLLWCSWFVLLPFAEQRLTCGTWSRDYARLFTTAWRHAFQLLLAGVFTGLFWGLLFLLAGLFKVLGVSLFMDTFTSHPFVYMATPLAFCMGLSLYAAREEALAGFWRSMLQVLGWLLPLACLIALLFLIALPVRGLAPLWRTGHATALMLGLMAWLVFLFNVAWSDGEEESQRFATALQRFVALGLLTMPVFIALCAYSLGLRVVQYGWSADRVWAALAVALMAVYAVGYAVAALRRDAPWMALARRVNVAAAWLAVALALLACTPVLDPARIAVASQLARLQAQRVEVQAFDFGYLRWDAGRAGRAALDQLLLEQAHPQAAQIRELAQAALQDTNRYARRSGAQAQAWTAETLRARLQPLPAGVEPDAAWLDYLLGQLREHKLSVTCTDTAPCPVFTIDMDGDGQAEQLLLSGYLSQVFARDGAQWRSVGRLQGGNLGRLEGAQMKRWKDHDVSAQPPRWRDVVIGGERYSVRASD